jgi:undecaprenyl-diphosphatase
MKHATLRRWLMIGALFVAAQILLIVFIDRPLSAWLRTVDAEHSAFIDVFRFMTDLGLGQWYLWPTGLVALGCFSAVLMQKKSILLKPDMLARLNQLCWTSAYFFLCVALSGLLTNVLKRLVGRSRPKLLDQQDVYAMQPFTFKSDWASWPSGHTTTIVAVALVLAIFAPRWRIPLLVIAVLIGLSRVIVNAHYLSDIVAGAMIATLTVLVVTNQFTKRHWLNPKLIAKNQYSS